MAHIANKKLDEDFHMNTVHMVLLKNGMDASAKENMLDDIQKVDGVKWALGLNSIVGPAHP